MNKTATPSNAFLTKRTLVAALLLSTASAAALPGEDPSERRGSPGSMPATANDLASVLEKVQSEEKQIESRLEKLTTEATQVHALLLARGRAYTKLVRAGLLPVGGGLDALVDHASRVERLRRSLSRDLEREHAISVERVALLKRRETIGSQRVVLDAEHAALARSHTAILAAEEREAAFRRAFSSGSSASSHTAVYGSVADFGPSDPGELSRGFAALKGRLPFPIEGRVEIRSARLASADGPGLEMVASFGAAVRAVHAGRVAFADVYADYGHAVIVDHGSGFYTVSGNLSAIDVKVGDDVRSGDRIGAVGTGPGGPVLYFELRRGTQTVNPAPWFGI